MAAEAAEGRVVAYVRTTWRCPECNHRWSLYHTYCGACLKYARPIEFRYEPDPDDCEITVVYDPATWTCTPAGATA
ncbi:MAG TPA: hypothetical protein ENH78_01640 [Phycisphaerae bacterium]|nr:hypothetical protein [Phycisphaerae bacterium]